MMLSELNSGSELSFLKMHGAGNDFIMLDLRSQVQDLSPERVAQLCHRHVGIGADGLLGLSLEGDMVKMHYFNADGHPGSFCGNGGRCFAFFAFLLGLVKEKTDFTFRASDGSHTARILFSSETKAQVVLDMQPVEEFQSFFGADQMDTGSPHLVFWPETSLQGFDVTAEGRKWRHHEKFGAKGINVNFAWKLPDGRLAMRTFERGVEAETLACGTGTVAVALSAFQRFGIPAETLIEAAGGTLQVGFSLSDKGFSSIKLTGPTEIVFSGQWRNA
jgi:diaminopimelate epimerase